LSSVVAVLWTAFFFLKWAENKTLIKRNNLTDGIFLSKYHKKKQLNRRNLLIRVSDRNNGFAKQKLEFRRYMDSQRGKVSFDCKDNNKEL